MVTDTDLRLTFADELVAGLTGPQNGLGLLALSTRHAFGCWLQVVALGKRTSALFS